MLSNAGLAIAIENLNGLETNNFDTNEAELEKKQNVYFAIILYSTFGLALVRFAGVCPLFPPAMRYSFVDFSVCSTSSNAISSDVAGGTERCHRAGAHFFLIHPPPIHYHNGQAPTQLCY
jgi:hypothetical protein